jgi:hypothetical protein
MELGSQGHRVDHDGLFVRVIVQNHDLKQPTAAVRTDDQVPPLARDYAEGVADSVIDVFIPDAVLSRAVRNPHVDRVALSTVVRQGFLVKPVWKGPREVGAQRVVDTPQVSAER